MEKIALTLLEKETIESEEFDAIIAAEKNQDLFKQEEETIDRE